jgi:hypothetical protein
MSEILRRPVVVQSSIVVETDQATSTAIDNRTASMLAILRTSGSVTTVNVFGSTSKDGTYYQITFDGSDLTGTVSATTWLVLPPAILALPWIKLVGNVAGQVQVIGKG